MTRIKNDRADIRVGGQLIPIDPDTNVDDLTDEEYQELERACDADEHPLGACPLCSSDELVTYGTYASDKPMLDRIWGKWTKPTATTRDESTGYGGYTRTVTTWDDGADERLIRAHRITESFVRTFATGRDRFEVIFADTQSGAPASTEWDTHKVKISPAPAMDPTLDAAGTGKVLTAMALHESYHVRYDQKWQAAIARAFKHNLLAARLGNLLGDARIETRGNKEYPGYAEVFPYAIKYVFAAYTKGKVVKPTLDNPLSIAINAVRYFDMPNIDWSEDGVMDEALWWQDWAKRGTARDQAKFAVAAVREALDHIASQNVQQPQLGQSQSGTGNADDDIETEDSDNDNAPDSQPGNDGDDNDAEDEYGEQPSSNDGEQSDDSDDDAGSDSDDDADDDETSDDDSDSDSDADDADESEPDSEAGSDSTGNADADAGDSGESDDSDSDADEDESDDSDSDADEDESDDSDSDADDDSDSDADDADESEPDSEAGSDSTGNADAPTGDAGDNIEYTDGTELPDCPTDGIQTAAMKNGARGFDPNRAQDVIDISKNLETIDPSFGLDRWAGDTKGHIARAENLPYESTQHNVVPSPAITSAVRIALLRSRTGHTGTARPQKRGTIDNLSLTRVAFNDTKIFHRRVASSPGKYLVWLMVDRSSSMRGGPTDATIAAAKSIALASQHVHNLRMEVHGWTTPSMTEQNTYATRMSRRYGRHLTYKGQQAWERDNKLQRMARFGVYRVWGSGENVDRVDNLQRVRMGMTPDAESLAWAVQAIGREVQRDEQPVIIMLSDGFGRSQDELRKVVDIATKRGIRVLSVAIGNQVDAIRQRATYGDGNYIEWKGSISQAAGDLSRMLARMVAR